MSELKWKWAYYPYLDPPEKQKESALKAGYIKVVNKDNVDEMDLYIAELEQKLSEKDKEIESLKASHYAEMVDAGMCERRLKRALWLARSYRGRDNSILLPSKFMRNVWDNVERKCLKKAEQYK